MSDIETKINDMYLQNTEYRHAWSSCGREKSNRPIDESCTVEELEDFYDALNASLEPKLRYKKLGNSFTLCLVGESSEFNLSSNNGLKVTQEGFIAAGNYLLPCKYKIYYYYCIIQV